MGGNITQAKQGSAGAIYSKLTSITPLLIRHRDLEPYTLPWFAGLADCDAGDFKNFLNNLTSQYLSA